MSHSYPAIQELDLPLNGQLIRIHSKPGIPHWQVITPAEALLAASVSVRPSDSLLLMGCGAGALAVWFGRQLLNGHLTYTDDHLVALQMTELTLAANRIEAFGRRRDQIRGPFDQVVICLPKGRKLARRWLAEAYSWLRPGGCCYLAGANPEGIQAVLKDAGELFGNVRIMTYKKGNRVGRLTKTKDETDLPVWAREAGVAPGSWIEFDLDLRGFHFQICSQPGVFSCDHLDAGTRFLIEHLSIPPGGRVLDFGCGFGILGMVAAQMGAAEVHLVDVHLPAIASAEQNLRRNVISNGYVIPSDILSAVLNHRYDAIISNPPFHSGQAVNYEIAQAFFRQAATVLSPGGTLTLVANRFIRYELFLFGQVEVLAENNQFRVMRATQSKTPV